MLTLTNDARQAIVDLTKAIDTDGHAGVRIAMVPAVNGDGPRLGLELADAPAPGDSVIDDDGARVFLDSSAGVMLDHQTLDARIDQVAQQVDFYVT